MVTPRGRGDGNWLLKKDFPSLEGMPPLQTADSFHGREGTISVVITGAVPKASAGFISNEERLNVMLTRQKSGLLIVGDKNATGALDGTEKEMKSISNKARKTGVAVTFDADGTPIYSRTKALRNMLLELNEKGRIMEVKGEGMTEHVQHASIQESILPCGGFVLHLISPSAPANGPIRPSKRP